MFEDIKPRTSFSEFIKQSETEKPYRSADGAKRYPLGLRRYSDRCWQFINQDEIAIYYRGELMGTARSDNTYEFHMLSNRMSYDNGEAAMMSRLTPGWIRSCSTLGGCVYTRNGSGRPSFEYPVFEGMRVHMHDGSLHESSKFVLETKIVNRKESKKYRTPHEDMFKAADAMFRVMDKEAIQQEMGDYALAYRSERHYSDSEGVEKYALQNMSDPVGTVMRLAVVYNYTGCLSTWWRANNWRSFNPSSMVKAMKTKFYEHIYQRERRPTTQTYLYGSRRYPGRSCPRCHGVSVLRSTALKSNATLN